MQCQGSLDIVERTTAGRKCLTLREKIEVIQLSGTGGIITRKLADRLGCGKTQITKALKNKQTCQSGISTRAHQHKRDQTMRTFSDANQLLWEWYAQANKYNIPVSGPLLVEETKLIAESLGKENFKGINGWLQKWKRRYNITEEGDVTAKKVKSWQERVKEIT